MSRSPVPGKPDSVAKRLEPPPLPYADSALNRAADLGAAKRRPASQPVRLAVIGAALSLILGITTAALAGWAWRRSCVIVPPIGDQAALNPAPAPTAKDWDGDCYDPKLGLAARDRAAVIAAVKAKHLPESCFPFLDSVLREEGRRIIAPANPPVRGGTLDVQISGAPPSLKFTGATVVLSTGEASVESPAGKSYLFEGMQEFHTLRAMNKTFSFIETRLRHAAAELSHPLTQPQADKLIAEYRPTNNGAYDLWKLKLQSAESGIVSVMGERQTGGKTQHYLTPDGRETAATPSQAREAELERLAAMKPARLMEVDSPVVGVLTILGAASAAWAFFALVLNKRRINTRWRMYAIGRMLLAAAGIAIWSWALIDFNAERVPFWPWTGFLSPELLLTIIAGMALAITLGFYVPIQLIRNPVASMPAA